MCTVVIRVSEVASEPIRVLAVRDEDPARPWNPLGAWWPDRPGVMGVQDRLAGGAWLAAAGDRFSVLLNRAGAPDLPSDRIASRGGLVLDAVSSAGAGTGAGGGAGAAGVVTAGGRAPSAHPRTMGFNLLRVAEGRAELSSWDGARMRRSPLAPGTHMIAHDDLDDPATPRIVAWREVFAAAPTDGTAESWWRPWLEVLERSTALPPSDDRAIIRDNRAHGYPTLSLLACVASITPTSSDVRYAELAHAGEWSHLDFAAGAA